MSDWKSILDRRMAEPGANEAYLATKLAFELGASVRAMREAKGMTQKDRPTPQG